MARKLKAAKTQIAPIAPVVPTEKQKFWTVNRKLCVISAVVPTVVFFVLVIAALLTTPKNGIASTLFFVLFLFFLLHVIYPMAAIKYLANHLNVSKNKQNILFSLGNRLYKMEEVTFIANSIFAGFLLFTAATVIMIINKCNLLVLALPYLAFHIFCFIKGHSPSIARLWLYFTPDTGTQSFKNLSSTNSISSKPHEWGGSKLTGPYNVGSHTSIHGTYYSNNR